MAITVFILDRQKKRLRACARLLRRQKGILLVGQLQNGPEAVLLIGQIKPRILVLDLTLLVRYARPLFLSLRQKSPRTKMILLSGRASQERILESLSYGAVGYLDDRVLRNFLPKAIRSVHAGEGWIPRKMVAKILEQIIRIRSRRSLP